MSRLKLSRASASGEGRSGMELPSMFVVSAARTWLQRESALTPSRPGWITSTPPRSTSSGWNALIASKDLWSGLTQKTVSTSTFREPEGSSRWVTVKMSPEFGMNKFKKRLMKILSISWKCRKSIGRPTEPIRRPLRRSNFCRREGKKISSLIGYLDARWNLLSRLKSSIMMRRLLKTCLCLFCQGLLKTA